MRKTTNPVWVQGINFKDKRYYINKCKEALGIILVSALFALFLVFAFAMA